MRDAALRARLATVSALGGRVYALGVPADSALPAAAYQLTDSAPGRALDGTHYMTRTWRIVIHAEQVAQARQIAEQVRASLESWRDRASGVEACVVTSADETAVDWGDGEQIAVVLTARVMEV